MVNIPTFTIKINQIWVNMPYMDPMGYIINLLCIYIYIYLCFFSYHTLVLMHNTRKNMNKHVVPPVPHLHAEEIPKLVPPMADPPFRVPPKGPAVDD